MASENDFQELQFSVLDTRQKVDGFAVFEVGSPKNMDNAANIGGKRDRECFQAKPKCNIRKSLAWDSAFFTSPGVLDPEELFQTLNFRDTGNSLDLLGNEEQKVVPSESLEAERTSEIGKFNLRKSLAWDSAFFNSAGVLEPEELSIINKGFKKLESHPLPGIEEELWRSVESNSTVDTDGFPLTSLEIDLFEDIRASAHKLTQVSNISTSGSNLQRGRRIKNVCSSKKDDGSSQVRMKSMLTSKGKSIAGHDLERVTNEASVSPQAQHGAGPGEYNPKCVAGTGEFNPKHAARNGEPHLSSSLKPPKISGQTGRISMAPAKRASLGTNHVKLKTQSLKATSGHCSTVSNKPCLEVSSSSICSSLPSPQSSLFSSPSATNESPISSSPHMRFYGSAADTTCKSPLSSLRGTGTGHVNLVSTGSTFRTPKYTTTNRSELEDSYHPTCLLSISKSSSCTSPVSSIDGCLLESSSTSVQQRSNNSTGWSDTSMETHQHNESCVGCESRERSSPVQVVKKIFAESSSVPSEVSRNTKPSCLRRPSPKIGFFDAENSTMTMITRGLQFHSGAESTLSKRRTGNNPNGAAKKTEYGKLQPTRKLKGTKDMKIGSQKTRVSSPALLIGPSYPVQFGEAEKSFPEVSAFSVPMKDCFAKTSRAQNNLPRRMSSKYCLKTKSLSKMGAECEDQGGLKAEKRSSRKRGDASLQSPETKLRILLEDEKENLYGIKKEVDSLSRHIGAFDLNSDAATELREKRGPSLPARLQ